MFPIKDVTVGQVAFGGQIKDLMPEYEDIPDTFKTMWCPWVRVQAKWFFEGLPKDTKFIPNAGVDVKKALAHLSVIQRSFEPKHEHKESGVAFLMSEWFEDIQDGSGKSMIKENK